MCLIPFIALIGLKFLKKEKRDSWNLCVSGITLCSSIFVRNVSVIELYVFFLFFFYIISSVNYDDNCAYLVGGSAGNVRILGYIFFWYLRVSAEIVTNLAEIISCVNLLLWSLSVARNYCIDFVFILHRNIYEFLPYDKEAYISSTGLN